MNNNMNKNGVVPGNPNGMKRRLNQDPRQRPNMNMHNQQQQQQPPNRFNQHQQVGPPMQMQQGGGRFPGGRGGRGHQQPGPGRGGRGFSSGPGMNMHPGRGPTNNKNMPPMGMGRGMDMNMNGQMGPGRGPPQQMQMQMQPPHQGRGPVPGRGPGRNGMQMQMQPQGGRHSHHQPMNVMMGGRGGAPPPPPPPPAMQTHSMNNNMHVQVPPPPPGSHYGPSGGRGIPPPPISHPAQQQQQHQQRPFQPQPTQQQYHPQQQRPPFAPPQQTPQHPPQNINQFQRRQPPNQNGGAMPLHMQQQPQPQQQPQYQQIYQQQPPQYQQQQQQQQQRLPPQQNQYMQLPAQQTHLQHNSNNPQHAPPAQVAASYTGPPKQQHVQQRHTAAVTSSATNTSSAGPAAQYTQEQLDQAWTEHTAANGVKYYHNSLLLTSTFTKPECLVRKEKLAAETAKRPWAEYTDASTGKKYYSNGVTTTWEKPEGFVSPTQVVAQTSVVKEQTTNTSSTSSTNNATMEPSKKKRKKSEKETEFENKQEAVAAFKGLLLAKDVLPTQKWHEVIKLCSSDSRWDDCEAVLSTGERKQAMAEYQTKRANELRTKERQERARAKDAFIQLLTEILPKHEEFSVWKSRFADIRDSISKDDRFYAVQGEEKRESLFLDFCEELRKHDERKKRNKKREAQDGFLSFLKEKEEAGLLSFSSTWNSFVSGLEKLDQADSRFKTSSFMTDSDRQVYFADFVIELQAAEDDKRRRIRDARRRAEKAQCDAFRDALENLASEGKLTPSSQWRDVEKLLESEREFAPVHEQGREVPREIFEEFIDEWEEAYRRDRSFLNLLVHPSSNREILVTPQMKYDEFVKALLEEAKSSPQLHSEARRIINSDDKPTSSARLYFKELVDRAKEKAAALPRRRSHARRGLQQEDSSEDEGEIIEDEEINEKSEPLVEASDKSKDENGKQDIEDLNDGSKTHVTLPDESSEKNQGPTDDI